jgi:hypothetical protein
MIEIGDLVLIANADEHGHPYDTIGLVRWIEDRGDERGAYIGYAPPRLGTPTGFSTWAMLYGFGATYADRVVKLVAA